MARSSCSLYLVSPLNLIITILLGSFPFLITFSVEVKRGLYPKSLYVSDFLVEGKLAKYCSESCLIWFSSTFPTK
jgi:hypothetical protein